MHHPQPSPPTHGSQYADDSCALRGPEVPAGPRLPSGRDDLWASLNGTAQTKHEYSLDIVEKCSDTKFH